MKPVGGGGGKFPIKETERDSARSDEVVVFLSIMLSHLDLDAIAGHDTSLIA